MKNAIKTFGEFGKAYLGFFKKVVTGEYGWLSVLLVILTFLFYQVAIRFVFNIAAPWIFVVPGVLLLIQVLSLFCAVNEYKHQQEWDDYYLIFEPESKWKANGWKFYRRNFLESIPMTVGGFALVYQVASIFVSTYSVAGRIGLIAFALCVNFGLLVKFIGRMESANSSR